MNTAYLLTGSNLGDSIANLRQAANLLNKRCGDIFIQSSLYETGAWGKTDQPAFLNQSVGLKTLMDARQLLQEVLAIEQKMGRIREERFGPRLIDIDILLFNEAVFNLPFLKIPHPELQNRRFALTPLAEIAADKIHPVFYKTISELLAECKDELPVKKYT
ncbi:MAG: 2-amino-4-hydroxy-6-hydroxymethyldihydropteridine diphosphokinase [Chitinophagaceae bacterium]